METNQSDRDGEFRYTASLSPMDILDIVLKSLLTRFLCLNLCSFIEKETIKRYSIHRMKSNAYQRTTCIYAQVEPTAFYVTKLLL